MTHKQVKTARQAILIVILALGAYKALQRVTDNPPMPPPPMPPAIPGLWAAGERRVQQVDEPPSTGGYSPASGASYSPSRQPMRIEQTACMLRSEGNQAIPCDVSYPADTSGPLPVVLVVTGSGTTERLVMRHLQRLASLGYIVAMIRHTSGGRDDGSTFESQVLMARGAIMQLRGATASMPVRPSGSFCLVGDAVTTSAVLALAGVPMVREDGARGMFSVPQVKAVALLDPMLIPERAMHLDITADPTVPVLMIHAADDRNAVGSTPVRMSRVYRIGSGKSQHVLDLQYYRGRGFAEDDADAAFRADVSAITAAFLDAHLRGDTAAKAFLHDDGDFSARNATATDENAATRLRRAR